MEKNAEGNKVLLIYNPRAGSGMFPANLDKIIEAFQSCGQFVHPVRGGTPELLDEVFGRINPDDYCKVIAAGGDGTLNLVVNAMIRNGINLPMGIFPAGTANDYAYYFDIPREINGMLEIATGNHTTDADVCMVNGEKYYINVLALGNLVDVSQKTDPNLKNTLGLVAYYLRALAELTKIEPFPVTIESEEFSGTESIYFMIAMNGRSAGGFRRIAEEAAINDGLVDVILFKELPSLVELPQLLLNLMQGNYIENKNVLFFQTAKVRLSSDRPIVTDTDGEQGPNLPIVLEVLEKKLKILTREDDMEGAVSSHVLPGIIWKDK
ncbi:MAG: YegS/Rv2252/BmrU family lipid kinase [Firmicutes bacterium]|nr:YegS/Rv2252/BmrU family lipid kinase [Bacillota bacterium]